MSDEYNYQLLSRMKTDCDYFLGIGNRNIKRCWSLEIITHINKMKSIQKSLNEKLKQRTLKVIL